MNHSKAAMVASAVAALLSTVACGSDGDDGKEDTKGSSSALVRCEGINECKGTSECKGEASSCEGMNECKGHGFITVPEEECEEKGGVNLDAKG